MERLDFRRILIEDRLRNGQKEKVASEREFQEQLKDAALFKKPSQELIKNFSEMLINTDEFNKTQLELVMHCFYHCFMDDSWPLGL